MNTRGTKRISTLTHNSRGYVLRFGKDNSINLTNFNRLTNGNTLPGRIMRKRFSATRPHFYQDSGNTTDKTGNFINLLNALEFNNVLTKFKTRMFLTMLNFCTTSHHFSHLLERIRQINARMNSMTLLVRILNRTRNITNKRTRLTINLLLRNKNNRKKQKFTNIKPFL